MQGVRAGSVGEGESAVECGESAADEEAVPSGAVLVEQEDGFAVGAGAGAGAGGLQFQEGDEAVDFGFGGGEFGDHAAESEGFGAQVGADPLLARRGRVALVEDQVDDFEDRGQAGCEVGGGGDFEAHVFAGEGFLRAADALGHGGFGDEEGAGDLGGGEAAEDAECESDALVRGEHGVAGGEDEAEHVVGDVVDVGFLELGVRGGVSAEFVEFAFEPPAAA